jgi:hypothetical protein
VAPFRPNCQNSALFRRNEWIRRTVERHFSPLASYSEADLTQSDPTDHALAAIASILDHPESQHVPEKTVAGEVATVPQRSTADGYYKTGPGPMAAIRFKWMARRADAGQYYVDETIGENSAPVVSGPMSGDDAVRFVDDRESEARRQFESLKSEMFGRGAAAALARKDNIEI